MRRIGKWRHEAKIVYPRFSVIPMASKFMGSKAKPRKITRTGGAKSLLISAIKSDWAFTRSSLIDFAAAAARLHAPNSTCSPRFARSGPKSPKHMDDFDLLH